ncbi:MAG: type II secretion system F family protein [Candidatus Riflebacteria bacterium]|nr:type II secretion system F family protein [Candidatus Riflebacteria bacterium]
MAVYSYEAFDSAGNKVSDIIDADSEEAARAKLRESGLYPTDIHEGMESVGDWFLLSRIGTKDIAAFTRQLATLVGAGFPIVDALSTLSEQTSNFRFKRMVMGIRDKVREGKALSEAIRDYPDAFPGMFGPMIKAGEKSGKLETILLQLSGYLDSRVRFQTRVVTAVAYPMAMLFMAIGVVIFLLTYVIPPLVDTFRREEMTLPWVTSVLILICDVLRGYWYLLVGALVLAYLAVRSYAKTESGEEFFDALKLNSFGLGPLYRQVLIARFIRTFGVLTRSEVPILSALEILKNVVQNVIVARALEQAKVAISQGSAIARPLKASGIFPPMVVDMINAGQKSGQLDTLLLKLAEDYELEVEAALSLFTSILEPIIILFMGLMVGFIVLAIVLPMLELNQAQVR